jgi:hypothetical protein
MRATSIIEPLGPGLQTEPKDSHPSMYMGVELPAILWPLYSSIAVVPHQEVAQFAAGVGVITRAGNAL